MNKTMNEKNKKTINNKEKICFKQTFTLTSVSLMDTIGLNDILYLEKVTVK